MTRVLLDTHTFLWFVMGAPELSQTARDIIEAAESSPLLSLVSAWEIAIKTSLGKMSIGIPLEALFGAHCAGNGIGLLDVEIRHLLHVATLPFHHRDPFDRLLVSQSLRDGIPLISCDAALDAYGVNRI